MAMQTEILDSIAAEHKNGFVVTGSYTTVSSSGKIRAIQLHVPDKRSGEYSNASRHTYIQFSLDSGVNWMTVGYGRHWEGDVELTNNEVKLRTNASSAGYEMLLGIDTQDEV